jgi:lipopolysaccharide export system protein LptA
LLLMPLAHAANAQTTAATSEPAPTLTPPPRTSGSQMRDTKEQLGKTPNGAALRPSGAVNITSKTSQMVQGASTVFSGDVKMDSDTLKMDGERLELKQFVGSQYIATLTGTPAHMSHPSTGEDDPPMTAHAKTIVYDSRNGIADLSGDAFVTKGEQTMAADTIHYNVAEKSILASGGGDSGRVHIVIPPATEMAPTSGSTPAPAQPQQ